MKGLYLISIVAIVSIIVVAIVLTRESFSPEEQNISSKVLQFITNQVEKKKDDFSGYIDFLVSIGYTKTGLINLKSYYAMYDLASKGLLTRSDIVSRM